MSPALCRAGETLLAIDPSVGSSGAALFANGLLVAVARLQLDREGAPGARVVAMGELVGHWGAQTAAHRDLPRIAHVVYEWPQVYAAAKSKGDPNALLYVASVGAAAAAYVRAWQTWGPVPGRRDAHLAEVTTYTPAEWIGQTPKTIEVASRGKLTRRLPRKGEEWQTARGKLIARMLTPAELHLAQAAGANHDAIDAIGIGLHAHGRIRSRLSSGATPG